MEWETGAGTETGRGTAEPEEGGTSWSEAGAGLRGPLRAGSGFLGQALGG